MENLFEDVEILFDSSRSPSSCLKRSPSSSYKTGGGSIGNDSSFSFARKSSVVCDRRSPVPPPSSVLDSYNNSRNGGGSSNNHSNFSWNNSSRNGGVGSEEDNYYHWRKNIPFLYFGLLSQKLEWPSLTVDWLTPMSSTSVTTGTGGISSQAAPLGRNMISCCLNAISTNVSSDSLDCSVQKLAFGTHTSSQDTDHLNIAEVKFPTYSRYEEPIRCESFSGFTPHRPRGGGGRSITSSSSSGSSGGSSGGGNSSSIGSSTFFGGGGGGGGGLGGSQGLMPHFDVKARLVHPGEVNRAVHMPQNPFMIVTHTISGTLLLFDYSKHPSFPADAVCRPQMLLEGHQMEGFGICWNSNERGKLASCCNQGRICLWDITQAAPTLPRASLGILSSFATSTTTTMSPTTTIKPLRSWLATAASDRKCTTSSPRRNSQGQVAGKEPPPPTNSKYENGRGLKRECNSSGGNSDKKLKFPGNHELQSYIPDENVVSSFSTDKIIYSPSSHFSYSQDERDVYLNQTSFSSSSDISITTTSPSNIQNVKLSPPRDAVHSTNVSSSSASSISPPLSPSSSSLFLSSSSSPSPIAANDLEWCPAHKDILASGSDDGCLQIWDGRDASSAFRAVRCARLTDGLPITSIAFNLHCQYTIASSGENNKIAVWDLRNLSYPKCSLSFHSAPINRIHWAPGCACIIGSASQDKTVILWDISKKGNSSSSSSFNTLHCSTSSSSSSSSEGGEDDAKENRMAMVGDEEEIVCLRSPQEERQRNRSSSSFSRDSSGFSASTPPEVLFIHGGHRASVSDFCWNSNKKAPWIIASVSDDNTLQCWQIGEHNFYKP